MPFGGLYPVPLIEGPKIGRPKRDRRKQAANRRRARNARR